MIRKPIEFPHLTDDDLSRFLPPNMNYPGVSTLFGHFSLGYVRYLASAMDAYTWFRYVESESKSYILKRLATRTLYKMLRKEICDNICAGNENGILLHPRAVGGTSRGVNYKAVNEDGIGVFENEDELILVTCDGVGDCLVGEVASFVILNQFQQNPAMSSAETFKKSCDLLIRVGKDLATEIPEFLTFPNEISQAAVTAARIKGNTCEISQVGDVLFYVKRGDELKLLDPHGEWLDLKQLTDLFANEKYLAQRHIIANAIGRSYDTHWEPTEIELEKGDLLIVASDGLETLHPKVLLELLQREQELEPLFNLLYEKVLQTNLAWQTPGSPMYTKPDNISIMLYRH
ncbi:MAG: hypothetical protein H6510_06810 [Acidobacteria bacterium]|nr:hypothetical protein [Acidobacteriota bacterium]MCB9397504.1 hypothetical protein [Acidobacteriota bacterium]